MSENTIKEAYNLLESNYYDHEEFEHVHKALEAVLESEDVAFQKRVLRKLLREVEGAWEQERADSQFNDPEHTKEAMSVLRKVRALIKKLGG